MSDDEATFRLPVSRGSPERFGYSWSVFDEPTAAQEEQFRRWTCLIPPEEWRDKSFLDVGCGMGRNALWAMKWGAAGGLAIDVDERSLEAARRNLSAYPSVEVTYRSAYEVGARDCFDIVFSIGVLHHLAAPERALEQMVQAARPGGTVLIWVYGYENNEWIVKFVDPPRRAVFNRLPVELLHGLSLIPAAMLWLALRLGLGRSQYLRLITGFPFRHLRHIVFDQMIPSIARYHRREEVQNLMENAGLHDVRLAWVNEMSWSAAGTKQA